MKILVIPDIHLKPWMFDSASRIMKSGEAERALCLMDIPDDWNQETNLDLYKETFDRALWFQNTYPDTLWCYGNHDLSYLWFKDESGFSPYAIETVHEGLGRLREALPDDSQMAYIHRIDDVLFLHGGLTHEFVREYASDIGYRSTDDVIKRINSLGRNEIWDDNSPVWFRPQFMIEKMYREKHLLQIVGHTPVHGIDRLANVVSCDVFSTYSTGDPIGTCEFLRIDTETWEYKGVK